MSVCGFGDKVYSVTRDNLRLDFSAVSADASGEIEVPVVLVEDYCWIDSAPEEYTAKIRIIR